MNSFDERINTFQCEKAQVKGFRWHAPCPPMFSNVPGPMAPQTSSRLCFRTGPCSHHQLHPRHVRHAPFTAQQLSRFNETLEVSKAALRILIPIKSLLSWTPTRPKISWKKVQFGVRCEVNAWRTAVFLRLVQSDAVVLHIRPLTFTWNGSFRTRLLWTMQKKSSSPSVSLQLLFTVR